MAWALPLRLIHFAKFFQLLETGCSTYFVLFGCPAGDAYAAKQYPIDMNGKTATKNDKAVTVGHSNFEHPVL